MGVWYLRPTSQSGGSFTLRGDLCEDEDSPCSPPTLQSWLAVSLQRGGGHQLFSSISTQRWRGWILGESAQRSGPLFPPSPAPWDKGSTPGRAGQKYWGLDGPLLSSLMGDRPHLERQEEEMLEDQRLLLAQNPEEWLRQFALDKKPPNTIELWSRCQGLTSFETMWKVQPKDTPQDHSSFKLRETHETAGHPVHQRKPRKEMAQRSLPGIKTSMTVLKSDSCQNIMESDYWAIYVNSGISSN